MWLESLCGRFPSWHRERNEADLHPHMCLNALHLPLRTIIHHLINVSYTTVILCKKYIHLNPNHHHFFFVTTAVQSSSATSFGIESIQRVETNPVPETYKSDTTEVHEALESLKHKDSGFDREPGCVDRKAGEQTWTSMPQRCHS